jgi:hypothetical protein
MSACSRSAISVGHAPEIPLEVRFDLFEWRAVVQAADQVFQLPRRRCRC